MQNLVLLIIFIIGLTIGSFLNCVIYRLEKGESFLSGRSYCPNCRHILTWQDLMPVLSFLILKGKCRYCQKPISWQYPLVELGTGILFVLVFGILNLGFVSDFGFRISDFFTLTYHLLITCSLIVIFVYDLKHYIIPDKIIYPAIIIAGIFNFQFSIFNEFSILKFSILSASGAAAFFLLIVLISQGKWMGIGDIKLAFFMGLLLGFPNILVALFLSFFIGAIIGTALILFGKKTLKSEIPFGPFLVTGIFIAMFWGQMIIDWYLRLLS